MGPLLICLAGGLGAMARLLVDTAVQRRWPGTFPLGIALINVSGSAVLGLLTGLAVRLELAEAWRLVLGTGFLGGYTTFSTASADTVRLLRDGEWFAGLVNGLGVLVVSVAAAAGGMVLGVHA